MSTTVNKIAVVIPTYERPDGKTIHYLTRALDSVQKQTFKNFRVYLIADRWEDIETLSKLVKKYDFEIQTIDIPFAKERDKYQQGDYRLFCAGGVNATNTGIDVALKDGYKYICHLDHDDHWRDDHLEWINEGAKLGYFFICTKSTHITGELPTLTETQEFTPQPCGLIHSSTCIDFSKTDLRFRDCWEETREAYPADADMWRRIQDKNCLFIDELTCYHDEEGYSRG